MSRDSILANVRAACDATGVDLATRREAVNRRLRASKPSPGVDTPADAQSLAEDFCRHIARRGTEIVHVTHLEDVPQALARLLGEDRNTVMRCAHFEGLAPAAWSAAGLRIADGRAVPDDRVSISTADAAISETGTLVFAFSATNPATLAYMPETHVVVLEASRIVKTMEAAFDRVRSAGPMPRTLGFISGPSRTGDIGGRIVMGAHGPRRLIVMVVE